VLQKKILDSMKSTLGLSCAIKLVAPKTIPRFEGKARRVIDNRKL